MAWIDWLILIAMAGAVMGGLKQGFLRSVCSLGGIFFGLLLAAWNYEIAAKVFLPIVRWEAVAHVLGFLLIVFVVTGLANLLGWLLHSTAKTVGLGCVDALLGGGFGFFQGWLLVTIVILLAAAFFPHAGWLHEGRMPPLFYSSAHLGAHLSPAALAEKIRAGLDMIEHQSPAWMHAHRES